MDKHPVAAHEKIAADLAFDLKLPVPPALLWERSGARSHGREVVVSAAPFKQALSWLQVQRSPLIAARLLPALSTAASAISPFDTWLMNGDRVNPGNVVVTEDVSVTPPLVRVAYIDFANSLSLAFGTQPDVWKDESWVAAPYPAGVANDLTAMSDSLSRIEKLPMDTVRSTVHRIPLRFLHTKHRDEIVTALLHRQKTLRSIMKKVYPGIT